VSDRRNLLLVHFFRLVSEIQPKAFVLENVPGILGEKYLGLLDWARGFVAKKYFVLEPYQIRAADVGAPTVRTRVVVVGFHRSIPSAPPSFWSEGSAIKGSAPHVRAALIGLPRDVHPDPRVSWGGVRTVRFRARGDFFERVAGRVPPGVGDPLALEQYRSRGSVTGCLGTRHSPEQRDRYAALAYGQADPKTKSVRLDPKGFCPTLRAGTGPERGSFQAVRPIHYLRPRVITPREAARLQGFPDWYQFDPTKWHSFRQIGNSVSPIVAEFVMARIARFLSDA
jgi:DNA (cytosine-5)-methyltransferase 1